ncbi:MAG TPA: sulfite exporter TauE/SafE family protein, partial [Aliiroseovarius sp.]|nr:sulfite exporter TauE/SafE family protein [Aliiroseovarius sp.]
MQELLQIGAPVLTLVFAVTLAAGFIKGAIGFGLPMIMVAGLAAFLPPDLVLAVVILPALVSNLWQVAQWGVGETLRTAWGFRLYIGVMLGFLALSAQLVRLITPNALMLIVGIPVMFFAIIQLVGVSFQPSKRARIPIEALAAALSGFVGGLSGIWGPPLVTYLTAIDTPKRRQMRLQGAVYAVAAVALFLAHLRSGVLNRATMPLSAYALVPTMLGMWLGAL